MLDKKEFLRIKKELDSFEEKREQVIDLARKIIKTSKLIIYGVHRGKPEDSLVAEIKSLVKKLPKDDYDTGMHNVALQEYVEALCFYDLIQKKNIPTADQLGVDVHTYLLGLCDLTGELVRKGVASVIKNDYKEAELLKDFVDEVYGAFLQFDLRNGELRKKSDQIKWNLTKLQDLICDLKIKQ